MPANHQVLFVEPGVAQLQPCDIPTPEADQILVRTRISLISPGTERAFLLGLDNTTRRYPQTAGYSTVGEVAALGTNVTKWQIGDVVATRANHRLFSALHEDAVQPLPPGLTEERAVFFTLAAIALQGVRKARIELGEAVAVVGAGLVGLLAAQLASLAGGLPVLAVDKDPHRLAFAHRVGVDNTVEATEEVRSQLESVCDGELPSVVIEATGHPEAVPLAFDLARPHGRVVLLGSTRGETEAVNFYRDVHRKGLTVLGAHDITRPAHDSAPGWWTLAEDQRVVLKLLAAQRLQVDPLITHRFDWSQAEEAYANLVRWDPNTLGMTLDWRSA